MWEDKATSNINVWICDIGNNFFALDEKMPEEKLIRKILRSLCKRFDIKVTSIYKA